MKEEGEREGEEWGGRTRREILMDSLNLVCHCNISGRETGTTAGITMCLRNFIFNFIIKIVY
jgi:hypothetical protein